MRKPVLIAETPFARGFGPRFLAPQDRGVDAAMAAHYVGQVRGTADDLHEIEGDDYLAVRIELTDEASAQTAPEILLLAGIDVNRMSPEQIGETFDQLHERIDVLADAVAAVDWEQRRHDVVIEIPELDEWHEAAWDALPRTGQWSTQAHNVSDAAKAKSPLKLDSSESERPLTQPSHDAARSTGERLTSHPTLPLEVPRPTGGIPESSHVEPAPDHIIHSREALSFTDAADHSKALQPVHASDSLDAQIEYQTRRRGWMPWVAIVLLLVGAFLYHSQVDRTWHQRIKETYYSVGPIRVIEKPVDRIVETVIEKPVDRIVEKVVEKPAAPGSNTSRPDQWAKFVADHQARIRNGELTRAADLLHDWRLHLPAWGAEEPPGLKDLRSEFQSTAGKKLREWALTRASETHRYGDILESIAAFGAANSVRTLLGVGPTAESCSAIRAVVRDAEDQYHYERIRLLASAGPAQEAQLKAHINAYVALTEPPGRMLQNVEELAEYRRWIRSGSAARASVRIEWGPRSPIQEHQIELTLGAGSPDAIARKAPAAPGTTWTDSLPIGSSSLGPDGKISYRIRIMRTTSAIEEFAEGAKSKTELFVVSRSGPVEAAEEPESGTKVSVECTGMLAVPVLPPWRGVAKPASNSK